MKRCDDCGVDARELWRHSERSESMTHRTVRWTCRDCNPDVDRPIGPLGASGTAPAAGTDRQPSD